MNQTLAQCQQLGIRLWVEGGALRYDAPKGALSQDLLADLKEHKLDLLAALRDADRVPDQANDPRYQHAGACLAAHFEERTEILIRGGGLPKPEAALEAAKSTATYARNAGFQWKALRMALSACPEALAALPDKDGKVDSLPLGLSRYAVTGGGWVVPQGEFTGPHEVTPATGKRGQAP